MVYTSLLCVLTFWHLTERVSCSVSMATYETTSLQTGETISMTTESTTTGNSFTDIVSKYPHVMVNITRGNKKPGREQKPSKPQKPLKPQLRLLEPPDSCMQWSPSLNISIDSDLRRVSVDYCQSGKLSIPDTYTCVIGNEVTLCTVVESPRCGHVFENLTTGNYTVLVQPLCKRCFNAEVYNTECITPHYTRHIHLEVQPEFGASVGKISNNLESGSTTQIQIIVSASCSGVFLVVIVVTYLMAKYTNCTKSLSCVHCNANINLTVPNFIRQPPSNDIERLQNPQQSFTNIGDETEAMLPDSFRLTQEQAHSHNNDTCFSMVPLNSNAARFSKTPSCQTAGSSSAEICDKHTTDQESQTHSRDNICQKTLQMYFATDTKITEPEPLFDVPTIRDIPYHLIR